MLLHGSCHCGKVRYELTGPVNRFTICHCTDCRKNNGTAFSANLVAASSGFKITAGEDQLANYESSAGKFRCFCKHCGTHLYARMNFRPEIVIVRAGTLDDDPDIKPQNHIWVSVKAPWHDITDSLPQFAEGFKG